MKFQVSVFKRILINNISWFKSSWFYVMLKILNFDWHQEIMLIVFWKHYFTWHTQKFISEYTKFLYLICFLNDDSESTDKTILVLLYRRIINNFCNCKYPAAQVQIQQRTKARLTSVSHVDFFINRKLCEASRSPITLTIFSNTTI